MRRIRVSEPPAPATASSMWMLASFALILLTLFCALNAFRVPLVPREKRVLQSVADKFRQLKEEKPENAPAPPAAWKEVLSPDGIRVLTATFNVLFSENGSLSDAGKATIQEIIPNLLRKRTVIEVTSLIPERGIQPENLYPALLRAEVRAQNVQNFLIAGDVPAFSLSAKTSLYSGAEPAIQLRVRPASERSGW